MELGVGGFSVTRNTEATRVKQNETKGTLNKIIDRCNLLLRENKDLKGRVDRLEKALHDVQTDLSNVRRATRELPVPEVETDQVFDLTDDEFVELFES